MTDEASSWAEGMRRVRLFPFPESGPFVSPDAPEPDGFVEIGWDQNARFPAFLAPAEGGGEALVPFTPMAQFPPDGYRGDFFVEAFSDAAIKARWIEARQDPATRARILASVRNLEIPHQFRGTGALDPRGRIDPHSEIDLSAVRRPAFFAAAPWREDIARLDSRTSVVEVTAPREPLETMRLGLVTPIKLRGWHVRGEGVPDPNGGRRRALAILVSGRNVETTGIHHPDDLACGWSPEVGAWLQRSYPASDGLSESGGARPWRSYILAFVDAGFDVLTLDKRGHGLSGGANDSNCGEQGEDLFRALDALETGAGARVLTPEGALLEGDRAAGRLLGGVAAHDMPVVLVGPSQGGMAVCWAMYKNFVGACDFDRPNPRRHGPLGYNIKAAMVLAPFAAGLGYRSPDESLVEAARRLEFNVQMFPSGEILGSIPKWTALFIGRGLWDFSESLEGTLECYRRANGLRALQGVRGPHGEGEWGARNIAVMQDRMTAFAIAAVVGAPGESRVEVRTIRDVVRGAPPFWAETAFPPPGNGRRTR
ncbi:hypothetical protein DFR50_11857 [Roseiarcus fermentans]|uniref:Alpha/beta hydrolase family protein n=1 Tax=Roseiarcus fermentans TaxID=1473586 RepID=A0A366F7D3_9HYPH|nr:hypothetical protein [Roseiarcus fermentans]RBP10571.1 hypothetical protein DFR50_11857 [Roseiarcus fermentans]